MQAPPRGALADQAKEAITAYGIPVAETRVTQRVAFVHSLTRVQTVLEYGPKSPAAPRDSGTVHVYNVIKMP